MAPKYLKSMPVEEVRALINSIDVVLSDCDGVLWRENKVIEGCPETVKRIKGIGKKFFYVTNNNSKTRQEIVGKCESFDYVVKPEEVLCASYFPAHYLKARNFTKKVYLIGGSALSEELNNQKITNFGNGPDTLNGDVMDVITDFKPDPDVGAVVVGFDENFSFPKLVKAATYLQDPDVHFIGSNPDNERPSPSSNKYPGAGCLISAIEAASGRKAEILGKPGPYICDLLMKKYGVNPERTLMIGDNCNTDILLGKRCGFKTLLVMSGITRRQDIDEMERSTGHNNLTVPDYYTDQMSDLLGCLSFF